MVCAILPAAPPLRPSEPIIFTLACTRVSIASFAPGVGFDMLIFLSNKFCRDHINVVRTEWSFAFVEYSDGGFQKASLEGKGLLFTGVAYVFNHKKKGRKESPLFSSWWLFRGILMAPPFCQTPRPFISLWAFNNAMLMRTTTVAKLIMNGLWMESCYGDQLDKGGSGLHTRVWDEKTRASCMRVDSSDSLALISFVQSGWQTLKKRGGCVKKV